MFPADGSMLVASNSDEQQSRAADAMHGSDGDADVENAWMRRHSRKREEIRMLNELWLHSQRRHCISFVGMIAGHERDVNHIKDHMQIGQVRSTWYISDHTSCLLCEHSRQQFRRALRTACIDIQSSLCYCCFLPASASNRTRGMVCEDLLRQDVLHAIRILSVTQEAEE